MDLFTRMCNKAHIVKRFHLLLHTPPILPPRVIKVYKDSQFGNAVADLTKQSLTDLVKKEKPQVELIHVDIPIALLHG